MEDAGGKGIAPAPDTAKCPVEANPNAADDAGKAFAMRGPAVCRMEDAVHGALVADCVLDTAPCFAGAKACLEPSPGVG